MKVSGIFKILITIVACVTLGAFGLNTLLPNATSSLVNSMEDMLFNATAMSFDFNGDGNVGNESDGSADSASNTGDDANTNVGVAGFKSGGH